MPAHPPLQLDPRQRAMLAEMGVRVWLPEDAAPIPQEPALAYAAPAPAAAQIASKAAPVRAAPAPSVAAPAAAPAFSAGPAPEVHSLDWPALTQAAAACQACAMCQGRKNTVLRAPAAEGQTADWLVVGEAPDEEEVIPNPTPTSEEDETMSEPTTVEAAIATQPIYATAKREFKLPSMSEYVSAFVRGGSDFAQLNENIRAAAPNVTTPDLPGVIPTPIIQNVVNTFVGSRPLVDATTLRPMPQGGSVFIRPVVSVHNSVGTATQNTTITASQFEINDVQITKTIQGGYVEISEAAIDWSQPEALGPLLDDMMRVYMDRTDLLACSELQTGTTNSNNFANASIADPAYWVEWMYTAAADILTGSNGNLPSILAVSPNVWKLMGSLSDSQKRPLFPQIGPMNAYGSLNVASTQGAFAFGLRVVVDRNLTSAGMTILDPRALESFELNKGLISVEQPSQLSRQIAVRGYWASKVVSPELSIKAAFV